MPYARRDLLALAAHLGLGGALLGAAEKASAAAANPFLEQGYTPVLDELTTGDLMVRGELPREIAGTYLRNGPNPAYPPISYTYPLDGDGMIHALVFEEGRVRYRNRFVMTAGLKADRRAGHTIYGGLMDPIVPDPKYVPPDGDPNRFKNVANTNVISHAGRILALYEGGLPYEMTPALETTGLYDFAGKLDEAMTAHPRIDPVSGEMLMFHYAFRPPFLVYSRVDASGRIVQQVPIETGMPFMVHDFSITPEHLVFFLCPVVFDTEAAKRGKSLLAWEPERGTRIAVLRREGTGGVRWIQDEAFFVYHFMNAHEADGLITIDYVQHGTFFTGQGAPSTLWRAVLDPAAGTIKRQPLDDRIGEFPRADPARVGAVNRYGWLPVTSGNTATDGLGALARYDFRTGASAVHEFGPGREIDEPLFVPRPGATGESEGWIMIYVYDRATDSSVCAVLDAIDITRPPVAEIVLPRRVPHGLHGNWLPG
jgi:carotenoid cleavage dioxygenase-like enzyme